VHRPSFEARVHELVAYDALIAGVTECMLRAWAALWKEYNKLHQILVQIVVRDELCRRFCRIPGVGPVTALTVKAAIDDPRRFVKSKTRSRARGNAGVATRSRHRHVRPHGTRG
jgi:transposase